MITTNNSSNHSNDNTVKNPFLLPEILLQLGYYLNGRDLINAILVNHTWHSTLQRYICSLKVLRRLGTVHQPGRNVGLKAKLFTAIASLTKLQELWLERLEVPLNESQAFLETCQRLFSLHLATFIWNLPDLGLYEFSGIQQLTFIKNKMTPLQELEFLAQCPDVRFFRWQTTSSLLEELSPQIQNLLNSRLKYLRTLAIQYAALSDADIAAIVTSLPALVNLHAKSSQFGQLATQAIVNSRKGIQELDICDCESATPEMIHAILSSCQDLETFGGDIYDMKDLARGPWVCKRLFKLHISIMSTSSIAEAKSMDHARMYDQLAQLTELSVLNLGDVRRTTRDSYDWIDLKLSSGLDRLKTLHNLEYFIVGSMHQGLGEAEQEWIRENMPNAEF
ncbi:hypothetical protein BGX27_009722 [Mortierella sp. AM989]|nr:hypothetical protein BGX27_009722 [Mortierella sp. AM989]